MQGSAVVGGGGGHVPHLGTEDGTSIPRGGAGIRALEVRGQDVADFAPEIAAAPLVPVPLGNKQARGDPRKERSQLRQIFRECAPGVGPRLVKTASALLYPPSNGAQVSRMCQMPNSADRPGVTPGRSGRSCAKFSGNVLQG